MISIEVWPGDLVDEILDICQEIGLEAVVSVMEDPYAEEKSEPAETQVADATGFPYEAEGPREEAARFEISPDGECFEKGDGPFEVDVSYWYEDRPSIFAGLPERIRGTDFQPNASTAAQDASDDYALYGLAGPFVEEEAFAIPSDRFDEIYLKLNYLYHCRNNRAEAALALGKLQAALGELWWEVLG